MSMMNSYIGWYKNYPGDIMWKLSSPNFLFKKKPAGSGFSCQK